MTTPLVSILIFVYNREDLLVPCVRSALAQTVEDYEIVLVDNASTDRTWEVCQDFARQDSRVRIFRNETNTGPVRNWIRSIEEARGQYAKVLLSDDLMSPTFLEKTLPYIKNPEVGFVYTGAEIGTEPGKGNVSYIRGDRPHLYSTHEYMMQSLYYQGYTVPNSPGASLFRLEDLRKNVLLEVPSPTIHDFPDHAMGTDILLYLLTCHQYPLVAHVPESLAFFRAHGGSVTTSTLSKNPDLWTFCYQQVKIWFANEHRDESTLQSLLAIEWVRDYHKNKRWLPFREVAARYIYNVDRIAPTSEGSEIQLTRDLCHVRRHIAQAYVDMQSDNELATSYVGNLGMVQKTVAASGIKNEPISDAEKAFLDGIRDRVSPGLSAPNAIGNLLAGMLYCYPHQLPIRYQKAPVPNWFVEAYLQCMFESPRLFEELGEVDRYYEFFAGWTSYLHENILNNPDNPTWQKVVEVFGNLANYTPLCFSDRDQLQPQKQRSQILEQFLSKRGFQLDYTFGDRGNRSKIRVGILASHFSPSAETFTVLPAFEHLDRDRFEIYLYAMQETGDATETYCRQRSDRFTALTGTNLAQNVQNVRNDDLDILLIGTNVTARSYPITLLALHRLARVQTISLSAPVTTGMRNIDYYIAGKLGIPDANLQAYYTEKLALLDSSGLCFSYPQTEEAATIVVDRASWGASESTTIFISGANFRKLNPEVRETWAKLLSTVPNSMLVLYPFGPNWGRHPQLEMPFVVNLKAALRKYNVAANRVVIVNPLPSAADVRKCLEVADIYLDSYPYSGAASVLDPLRVGLPIVAMEGNEQRFRQSASLLRELQITDLIAKDESSYIQLAASLANNPQLRQQKRVEIQQKMPTAPFLDSRSHSQKMGQLFEDLLGKTPRATSETVEVSTLDRVFTNRAIGCANLYEIDPEEQSIIEELRQIRRQLAEFWLNLPTAQLEPTYNTEVGKAYKYVLKCGFLSEPLTPEEATFKQQLTQQAAGLTHPQATNAMLGAMLYSAPGTLKVRDAATRLPRWLLADYQQVFESDGVAISSEEKTATVTPNTVNVAAETVAPHANDRGLFDRAIEYANLYEIDPTKEATVAELRQIRRQLAEFWLNIPTDKLETSYAGDAGKAYKAVLKSGIQNQSLTPEEDTFKQQLTQQGIGFKHPQAVNAFMGAMLYYTAGTMKVENARDRLPVWLFPDYAKIFESATSSSPPPEPISPEQTEVPVVDVKFLNRLVGCVNLYHIDPSDMGIIEELRSLRRQVAAYWLSLPVEQLESTYNGDFGKAYKALLGCGFAKEPLTSAEETFKQQFVTQAAGLIHPQALNAVIAAMPYHTPANFRIRDARDRLPGWLVEDYERWFEGKTAASQIQSVPHPASSQFYQMVFETADRHRSVPTDTANRDRLRLLRRQLADFWLSLPPQQLQSLYEGDAGRSQKALLTSNLKNEDMTPEEQAFFAQLGANLQQGANHPKALNCLLGAMLYCPQDKLQIPNAENALPPWLLSDYQQFFTPPQR